MAELRGGAPTRFQRNSSHTPSQVKNGKRGKTRVGGEIAGNEKPSEPERQRGKHPRRRSGSDNTATGSGQGPPLRSQRQRRGRGRAGGARANHRTQVHRRGRPGRRRGGRLGGGQRLANRVPGGSTIIAFIGLSRKSHRGKKNGRLRFRLRDVRKNNAHRFCLSEAPASSEISVETISPR